MRTTLTWPSKVVFTLAIFHTILILGLVGMARAELPNTVLVGYSDGGFIGFQRKPSEVYTLATTASGACVINTSPTETVAEITMLENHVEQGALLEEFDEFGVQMIQEPVATVAVGSKRALPRTFRNPKASPTEIPRAEAALRVPVLNVTRNLNIREHSHKINPKLHPVAGGTLMVSNSQQWSLVYLDDFDQNADGWALSKNGTVIAPTTPNALNDRRQSCNGGIDKHLGGYCEFSREEISKTYTHLPPHSSLQVTARFHFFDYWLGEYAYAKVNGQIVWMHSHAFCSKPFAEYCKGVDACGDNKFADKMSHLVKITIPHTTDTVTVTFGTSLDSNPCKASWAIDDVAIYTKF